MGIRTITIIHQLTFTKVKVMSLRFLMPVEISDPQKLLQLLQKDERKRWRNVACSNAEIRAA